MLNHHIKPSAKFVLVRCKICKHEQTIFTKATTKVKCCKCNIEFTEPKGGKCKLINCNLWSQYYG